MNYEEQRMAFWREAFLQSTSVAFAIKICAADDALAEFEKRFAPKTEPLPELTK